MKKSKPFWKNSLKPFLPWDYPFGKVLSHFKNKSTCFRGDGLFSYTTLKLVKNLNIDEFLGFSPQLNIAKVRQILGPDICLNGNVDPIGIMTYGSPGEVEIVARDCIQKAEKMVVLSWVQAVVYV